jgi:polyhydroxybutyrate depolymerase
MTDEQPHARSIEAVSAGRLAPLLVVTAVVASACGARGHSPADPPSSAAAADTSACPSAGGHALAGGRLYVPATAAAGRTPLLVVVIPGSGGDARDRLGLRRAGLPHGLAVLYPTQDGDFWSLNHEQGDEDLDAAAALVERTLAGGCFDERRLTVTGVSNGAGFATRLACELPGKFAGLAPVSAGFRALDPCSPRTRASLLAIHGTADTVVPYNGKRPGREGSVPRFVERWARRLGCGGQPRETNPRAQVTRIAYRSCDGGSSVTLVRLTGTTHGWPGARVPGLPQRNPSGFRATPEVVRFALAARRP